MMVAALIFPCFLSRKNIPICAWLLKGTAHFIGIMCFMDWPLAAAFWLRRQHSWAALLMASVRPRKLAVFLPAHLDRQHFNSAA